MSKWIKVLGMVAVVGLLMGAGVSIAYAQDETPQPDPEGAGCGFMGRGPGLGPRGEGGFLAIDEEALHAKFADALGITSEAFEAAIAEGETLYSLAQEHEVDFAVLKALMEEAHAAALAQAVEDGRVTQEQADWILERREAMGAGAPEFFGRRGPGAFGLGAGEGPLALDREALDSELAAALGISVEDFRAAMDEGANLYDLAQTYEADLEELKSIMDEARAEALEEAVEAGVITQEQADFLLERGGFRGPAFGDGRGGRGFGGGMMLGPGPVVSSGGE